MAISREFSYTDCYGHKIPIEIIRSKRKKTLVIEVLWRSIRIRSPQYVSDNKVKEFLQQRKSWIHSKIKKQLHSSIQPRKLQFVSGELICFAGQHYRLHFEYDNNNEPRFFIGQKQTITCMLPTTEKKHEKQFLRKHLRTWYCCHDGLKFLVERSKKYSDIIGVIPKSIKVRSYKALWGSCSLQGDICYNYRILLAPLAVIDYIIIHELCHLQQHNHSPLFWSLVKKHCPDYLTHRRWLRDMGLTLII